MNYNVGDVVVDFQSLSLWDNVFHFQKTLNTLTKRTVVAANEKFFTMTPGIDLEKFSGLCDSDLKRKVFLQKNGTPWDGTAQLVNLTNNTVNVMAYLDAMFETRLAKCATEDEAEIKKLEAEIAHKQAQIERIRAGKRPISYKHDVIERDFVLERKAAILKHLG